MPWRFKKIEKAVCSAYKTLLWAARQATKPFKKKDVDLETHAVAHKQFINFFNAGKEYESTFWYSSESKRVSNVNKVRHIIREIIDELDDTDGTLYRCDRSKQFASTNQWFGYAVWLGRDFLDSLDSNDKNKAARTRTIIHELSHLYVQREDNGGWYISMINNGRPLYVRIPGFDSDGNLECEHGYEPNIDRTKNADTVAWLIMQWYVP